ncbi:hypothetical protein B296_00009714 [Ensete ventricosum]|uniref:Uncharacterized protein n=1 Tax=Ensete ventricosum TaxID=4639 RepID=A0A427AF91_ENSVE|nr:hypothetical protein B296_00009714 [Ensete ventricosum]
MFVKRGVYSSASSTRTAPYAGSGQRRGGNGENTKRMLQLQRPYRSLSIWRLTSLLFLAFTISNVPPAFTSMLRSLLINSHHHRLHDFHHLVRWYPLLASPALLLAVYITCFHLVYRSSIRTDTASASPAVSYTYWLASHVPQTGITSIMFIRYTSASIGSNTYVL